MAAAELNDRAGHASVFHESKVAAALWHRPVTHLSAFLAFLEQKNASLADPRAKLFHLAHLMPPPSYEYAFGLRLPAGAAYDPPFPLEPDCALTLRAEPGTTAHLSMAGLRLEIDRASDAWRVRHANGEIEESARDLLVSCRMHGGAPHFAVNGRALDAEAAPAIGADAAIKVHAGTIYLIAAQTLAGRGRQLWFPANPAALEELVEFRDERNPFRFDWGLRTYGILNHVIAVAVARDMLRACPPGLDRERTELRDGIAKQVADLALPRWLLDAYLKWPHWRPGVGPFPEVGAWDRNSFTNGTIPALVGLLARITGREDEPEVRAAFLDRGGAFLNTMVRADFLKLGARNHAHWMRRSANHGLVMLSAFMLGARLLGLHERRDISAIETLLGRLLHDLHEDGSFCEGIAYDVFALGFFLPYRALVCDRTFEPGRTMRTLDAVLGRTFDWMTLSHDANGEVFANFGDNFTDQVRRTSHLAYLVQFARSSLGPPAGCSERIDEQFSFAPPLEEAPPAARGLEARLYPLNRFFLAADHDSEGGRRQGLFVIGSRRQLTHSRNHDCGGFAFYRGDSAIVIPSSQAQSWSNNAVGLERGGSIVPHAGERSYSGLIKQLAHTPELCSVATFVKFDASFSVERDARWLARTFTLRSEGPLPLVVATRIKVAAGVRPFLGLQLRALGLSVDGDQPWLCCFGRSQGTAWQTLAADYRKKVHCFGAPIVAAEEGSVFEFLTCVVAGPDLPDPIQVWSEAPFPRKLEETG